MSRVTQAEFHQAARAGRAGGAIVSRAASVLRVEDRDRRIVRFVFSDNSIDRVGDTISVSGWDLSSYKRNPTVLFAHDSSAPPVGRLSASD